MINKSFITGNIKTAFLFCGCLVMAWMTSMTSSYSQSICPEVTASSGDYYTGTGVTLSWTLGEPATETYQGSAVTLTQGFQQPESFTGFSTDLRVLLEGPYNGNMMNTSLNPIYLPLFQPFSQPPWNYFGSESVSSIPNTDVVDWILVELRDAPDAASAVSATAIAGKAGFLLKDGSITGLDGISPMQFNENILYNLFVVIIHRNHLDIMSANSPVVSGGIYTYDFSTGSGQVYGGSIGYKEIGPGVWGMAGGDGNSDGQVSNLDKNDVWSVQAGTSGYQSADFDLDGEVNNNDKIEVWSPNGGMGGQVP
ncbi:MAG: hypothetical protein JW861_07730 [Bacteroidales bacterium]|nr:hypothetical protein [Bacteroidales bacterium]